MEVGVKPEKTVLPLETTLILSQKPVEMMEEYPVEDGPLRMSGTIESRHGGRMASRNGPKSRIPPRLPEYTGGALARRGKSSEKTSTGVDAKRRKSET